MEEKKYPSCILQRRLPLESIKTKVKANLANLENGGVVSSEDHFQAVINSLAQVSGQLLLIINNKLCVLVQLYVLTSLL